MAEAISWKDWALAILLGLIVAGNMAGGTMFVMPNSAANVGYDLFSLALWGAFFWSLTPFLRKAFGKKSL
ncbi:MAG: hypothetical protein ACRD4C_10845 [Candidatus Acidiferrales bacterium]